MGFRVLGLGLEIIENKVILLVAATTHEPESRLGSWQAN